MIIFRYIAREVLTSSIVVTAILILIFLCNQFVRYLGLAANGKIASGVVIKLLAVQVPILLALLLPLGLYLGVLLSFGRFYVDSEMTVFKACGISQQQILKMTVSIAAILAVVVAVFMFWVNPQIMSYKDHLLTDSSENSLLATIYPGRFKATKDGRTVYYVESMTRNRSRAKDVFMAELPSDAPKQSVNNTKQKDYWDLLSAESAEQRYDKKNNAHFLVMKNGYRIFGTPGKKDFRFIQFGEYGVRLDQDTAPLSKEIDALPTLTLMAAGWHNAQTMAELQWRFSLPLSVFLLALLAIPLSKVDPRRGRYARLLPAILIYVVYANLLFVARAWLEKGTSPLWLGMSWVHLSLLVVALGIWWRYQREQ